MISRKRTSAICLHQDNILAFKASDPSSKKLYFFLPGGAIEQHETAQQCVVRETLEETGYRVKLLNEPTITKTYAFFWNDETYDCVTEFFLVGLAEAYHDPKPVLDASYNHGPVWLPRVQIDQIFSYQDDILSAVKELTTHRLLSTLSE